MSGVEFKEVQDFVQVDKLKIVACDGRSEYFIVGKKGRSKGILLKRGKNDRWSWQFVLLLR